MGVNRATSAGEGPQPCRGAVARFVELWMPPDIALRRLLTVAGRVSFKLPLREAFDLNLPQRRRLLRPAGNGVLFDAQFRG